jgi:isopenicillin-N epimerase
MKSLWSLNKTIDFLNHGSFGACPTAILAKQQEYRQMMEAEPVAFMIRELDAMLWNSKTALADFVHCQPVDLALVTNATHGANTVLKSIDFKLGDEILTTNHIYNACRITIDFVARQKHLLVKEIPVPFPIESAGEITEIILKQVTNKTKLVFIDHITSPTALIFPVKEIVTALNEKGVDCFVDGAHAPGGIPLNLTEIGAAYYTGNCHKWLCAPKSIAFLHVRKDKQADIHPLAHSHFSGPGRSFVDRFHWSGTLDPTAALCIPDVIRYFEDQLTGGWKEMQQHNHSLILKARKYLCDCLNIPLPCPDDMISTFAAIPYGQSTGSDLSRYNAIDELQDYLFTEHHIEIPVFIWPDNSRRIIRPSAQLYNDFSQYVRLADAILNF